MTTREIAQAVGKDERSVRRWVNKSSDKMTAIADKMTASSSTHPADFDLEETIYIIETGMGKNAADVYRNNAEVKPSCDYVTKMDIVEICAAVMAQVVPMITAQVVAQVKASPVLAITHTPDYFSVLGFCNNNGFKMGMPDMMKMGRECSRISRERDVDIKKIPDDRFGTVNAYHIEILKEVFSI